jgi:hypothetical protein
MQDEAVANRGSGVSPIGAMTSDFGGGLEGVSRFRPSQPHSLASDTSPLRRHSMKDSVVPSKDKCSLSSLIS